MAQAVLMGALTLYRFTGALNSQVLLETPDLAVAQAFFAQLEPFHLPHDQVYVETLENGEVVSADLHCRSRNALN